MIYAEHKITLDVNKPASQATLSVKKGDNARRLLVTLSENGRPYYISEDCYAVIAATKPDGYVIFNNCSIENNVICYYFTPQTVAAVGLMNCEIILYGKRGLQLTSASFDIIIEDSNYSAVESSSEANAFASLLMEIKALNALGLRAPAIICEAKGENISLRDASNEALQGLRIFGKSIQDGTPTPGNPVEIVSIGAEGEITSSIAGRNLLDASKITTSYKNAAVQIADSGKIIKIYTTGEAQTYSHAAVNMDHLAGRKFYVRYDNKTDYGTGVDGYLQIRYYLAGELKYIENAKMLAGAVEIPAGAYDITFAMLFRNASVVIPSGSYVQFEGLQVSLVEGSSWEPYKEIQSLAVSTLDGLRGLRVTSDGNYTDSDGQQWICDEVDLGRGVYVQRIMKIELSGDEGFSLGTRGTFNLTLTNAMLVDANNQDNFVGVLCDSYAANAWDKIASKGQEGCALMWGHGIGFRDKRFSSVAEFNAFLSENPVTVIYILEDPIETPLSSEEKTAFAQLQTYKPNTTFYNDVGACMAAEYVADTKTYVDRKGGSGGSGGSSVTLGTVTLLANKWQGDPYRQVVSIAGVTEYSQVDLKPSVAQLAIFHDKDLAFVTENDGGTVTVYAIGDKPENDYTIQVSITEVNV